MVRVTLIFDSGDSFVIVAYRGKFYYVNREKLSAIPGEAIRFLIDSQELTKEIKM